MAEIATLARPYARAAFRHALEQQALPAWSDLLAAGSAVAADPVAAALFGNPRVTGNELVELIASVATGAGARIDEKGRNFLALLAENHRLALLPEIAAQFETLRADVENTVDVDVRTAMALTDAQREKLAASLAKRLGRAVRLHERIDADLLGGAVITVGDLVIDGSLTGRLARLEQQMSQP